MSDENNQVSSSLMALGKQGITKGSQNLIKRGLESLQSYANKEPHLPINSDEEMLAMVKIIRAYPKRGIKKFRVAVLNFQVDFAGIGDPRKWDEELEIAWEMIKEKSPELNLDNPTTVEQILKEENDKNDERQIEASKLQLKNWELDAPQISEIKTIEIQQDSATQVLSLKIIEDENIKDLGVNRKTITGWMPPATNNPSFINPNSEAIQRAGAIQVPLGQKLNRELYLSYLADRVLEMARQEGDVREIAGDLIYYFDSENLLPEPLSTPHKKKKAERTIKSLIYDNPLLATRLSRMGVFDNLPKIVAHEDRKAQEVAKETILEQWLAALFNRPIEED